MRLYEYESKRLLQKNGLTIPEEIVAATPDEAVQAAETLGYPVMVKAQVLTGGRGKAGGVRGAGDAATVRQVAQAILGMQIKGETCRKVLVTRRAAIATEFYLCVTLDVTRKCPVLLFSNCGGVEIENTLKETPESLRTLRIPAIAALRYHSLLEFFSEAGVGGKALPQIATLAREVLALFFAENCTLFEINPLVLTPDNAFLILDAKAMVDEAAQKHTDIAASRSDELSDLENKARRIKVNYVPLDGDVAVIAGGAGLAMATMDLVHHYGGKVGSFIDTGGGISIDSMTEAVRISLATPGITALMINIFGGINNCEDVARGIATVVDNDHPTCPIVVKMRGHSQDAGWSILESRNIPVTKYGTTEDLVDLLAAQGGNHVHSPR